MSTMDNPEAMDTDGAMGAGAVDAPDLAVHDGGDATGGGSPGDPDDMGADPADIGIDAERTVDDSDDERTLDNSDFGVEPENPQQLGGLGAGEAPAP